MRSSSCAAFVAFLLASASVNAAPFPSASSGQLPVSASSSSTTRVENILDPVEVPYQQSVTGGCGSAGLCNVTLPATTHATTLILHASCVFGLGSGGLVLNAGLSGAGGNNINELPVSAFATLNGNTTYNINAGTYLFFTKGQQPQVGFFSSKAAVQDIVCTLSGYTT